MEGLLTNHVLNEIASEFSKLCKRPEIYVEKRHVESEKFKQIAIRIYDYIIAANSLTDLKSKSLNKLLVDGFDEEQIWQQIELQNTSALPHLLKGISSINPGVISFSSSNNVKPVPACDEASDDNYSGDDALAFDDDSSIDLQDSSEKRLPENEFVFDDDSSIDLQESSEKRLQEDFGVPLADQSSKGKKKKTKKLSYKSQVDDQFFKLAELEDFLKLEDLKEETGALKDVEDEIDLFQDIPSDGLDDLNSDSDEEEQVKKSSKDVMYEDFFDAPVSGDESISNEDEEANFVGEESNIDDKEETFDAEERDSLSDVSADPGDQDMEQDTNSKNKTDSKELKTAFELEQEKIRKNIQEYENKLLEPLPWHLTGEVTVKNRPVDSLFQQDADFDSNARKKLVVDNALNEKIESVIKMIIMNKAYCDVERKYKPTEDVIAYKKEVVLDQTKSKKGLAEVYEEDYIKKKSKQEEQEDPKHVEIKKLMDSLFPELHALFSHIPKPAVPEIKIVSNLPAITVEEVAPTSVSDVTLLAPEEIKRKTGLVKSKPERTDTDRKRERRKKKSLQKLKAKKMKEKAEADNSNPSGKPTKPQKEIALKKLKQHRNTKIGKVDEEGKIKSSKDFFSRLQDTMDSKVDKNKKQKRM